MFFAVLTNQSNSTYETDKFKTKNELIQHVNQLFNQLKKTHYIKDAVLFNNKKKIGVIDFKEKQSKAHAKQKKREYFFERRRLKESIQQWQNSLDLVGHAWRRNKILYALYLLKEQKQFPSNVDVTILNGYNPDDDLVEIIKSVEVWRWNDTGELAYISKKLRPKFVFPVIENGTFVAGYDPNGREYTESIFPSINIWPLNARGKPVSCDTFKFKNQSK